MLPDRTQSPWSCDCGRYRGIKFKDFTCDQCNTPIRLRGQDSLARGNELDRQEIERMRGETRSAAKDMIDYMASGEFQLPSDDTIKRLRGQ